jgi:hypothetical protein
MSEKRPTAVEETQFEDEAGKDEALERELFMQCLSPFLSSCDSCLIDCYSYVCKRYIFTSHASSSMVLARWDRDMWVLLCYIILKAVISSLAAYWVTSL